MDERDEVTCTSCGERWPAATARFCGRCGALLGGQRPDPAPDPGALTPAYGAATEATGSTEVTGSTETAPAPAVTGDDGRVLPDRGRKVATAVGVVVVVGLVVAGALTAGPPLDDPDGADAVVSEEGDEEAPDEQEPDGPASDQPEAPGDAGMGTAGEPRCVPDGCELWRVELSAGHAVAGEGLIVHVASAPSRLPEQDGDGRAGAPVRVTAVEPLDGRVRWQMDVDVVRDGSGGSMGLHRAIPVGDLVLVPADEGLAALDAASGAVRWVTPIHLDHVDGAAALGDDVLIMGWGSPDTGDTSRTAPDAQRLDPLVVRVDPADGEVIWRVDAGHLVGREGSRLLVSWPAQSRYGAIDADTGGLVWEREGPTEGSVGLMPTAEGRTVAIGESSAEVLDLATGELLRTVDLGNGPHWPIRLVGSLLAIGPDLAPGVAHGSGTGDLVLVDLADPDAAPRRLEGVSAVVGPDDQQPWLFFHPLAGEARPPAAPGALIVSRHAGPGVVLTRLEASGRVGWRQSHTRDVAGSCCWRVVAGQDPDEFVVVPSDDQPLEVRDADTGELIDTFAKPRVAEDVGGPTWWDGTIRWELSVEPAAVAGPAGRFEAPGGFEPVAFSPVPVVAVDGTLIALDVERLTGR